MAANGITLYTATFDRANKELMRDLGLSYYDIFKDQMRMLVELLYHYTPPPTKGNRGKRGGRKGGKAIILQDLYWVAEGRSPGYIKMIMDRFGGSFVTGEFTKKGGETYLIENAHFATSEHQLKQWHESKRKGRGIVFTHKGHVSKDIGRWTPRDKMYVPNSVFTKYLAKRQKEVGKLKDGWAKALSDLGSSLPPAWVKRAGGIQGQFGLASGDAKIPPKTATLAKMNISAWNDTPYIRDADGMVKRAEKVRLIDVKKRLNVRMEQLAKGMSAA